MFKGDARNASRKKKKEQVERTKQGKRKTGGVRSRLKKAKNKRARRASKRRGDPGTSTGKPQFFEKHF